MAKILTLKVKKDTKMTNEELVKSFVSDDEINYQMNSHNVTVPLQSMRFSDYVKSVPNEELLEKETQIARTIGEINKGLIAYHYYVQTSQNPNPNNVDAVMSKAIMAKGLLTCQLEELKLERSERGL